MRILALLSLVFLAFSCSTSNEDTLNIYAWHGEIKPDLIKRFETENHCRVIIDFYDSNEALYAKLKLGATGYDLIFPSNYYVDLLQKQDLIQPLDTSRIANFKNMDPKYCCPPEPIYGIPYVIGFSGLAYRKDRLDPIEPSYGVFFRTDIKGRMTMLNDLREVLGAALKYLGYSINSRNPEEIEKATEIALQWRKNLAKFEAEQYKSGLASGEFLVTQGYSLDIMQAQKEYPDEIEFVYPKEGGILHQDCLAIPSGARNPALAYKFINFLLEPNVAAENIAHTNALTPVLPAYDLIDPSLKNNPILFPPDKEWKKMEIINDLQEDIRLYNKAWNKIKAG